MRERAFIPLVLAVGAVATVGVVGYLHEAERIRALGSELAVLQNSLGTLGGQVGQVAEVAQSAASSTKGLAGDIAASSKAAADALKSQGNELQNAVAAVNPAVVSIVERDTSGSQENSGTGFVVRSGGYIVTNRHVVEDTTGTYTAAFPGGKEKLLTIVWLSPSDDLAIAKIAGSGYPTVALGDSSSLVLGQQVFAVGNALGRFDNTVSVGVVSGLNRSITAADPATNETISLNGVIQTDAAINPGNSGGPLVNLAGKAVGISVATARGSQSVGFALPISRVRAALLAEGI